MDNFQIDIISEGVSALKLGLDLAMSRHTNITHWKVMRARREVKYYNLEGRPTHTHSEVLVEDPKAPPTLILLWHDERSASELPAPMKLNATIPFVENWLEHAEYGREPDHDGSNGRGFRLFTEGWGHVYDHHYAVVGVQPVWALYGK